MAILTTLEMYTTCVTGVYGGWKGSPGTRVTVHYELLNSGTQTQGPPQEQQILWRSEPCLQPLDLTH